MIKVWDPLLRLLHWSLVASIAIAWLTGEDGEALHEWAGYAALGLIAFRLVWGGGWPALRPFHPVHSWPARGDRLYQGYAE